MTQAVRDMASVIGVSSFLTRSMIDTLMEDDRLVHRVDDVDADISIELECINNLLPETFDILAAITGGHGCRLAQMNLI